MKFSLQLSALALLNTALGATLNGRTGPQFDKGQPDNGAGKGGPLLGMSKAGLIFDVMDTRADSSVPGGTNKQIDIDNQDNLGRQSTDNGIVPNLKWRFSDSKVRLFYGGWLREQVIQDLPQSHDISAAQQHLDKGGIRELHWHRVAEWGFVYSGSVRISVVDEFGRYQVETLNFGDIWYFPKGVAHTVQGLEDENEFLLVFDDADFDKIG